MQANCPSCKALLNYDTKHFGKRFKCAKCLAVVEIDAGGIPRLVAPNPVSTTAFRPAPSGGKPIKYKCKHCKAVLETDEFLGMKEEACPLCKKINTVPASQRQMREQKEQQKAVEREAKERREAERQLEAARRAEAEEVQRQRDAESQQLAAVSQEHSDPAPSPVYNQSIVTVPAAQPSRRSR